MMFVESRPVCSTRRSIVCADAASPSVALATRPRTLAVLQAARRTSSGRRPRALRGPRGLVGGVRHLSDGAGEVAHRRVSLGFEASRDLDDRGCATRLLLQTQTAGTVRLAFGAQGLLNRLDRKGHVADLVAASGMGHRRVELAVGNGFQGRAQAFERRLDLRAGDPNRGADRKEDQHGAEAEKPDFPYVPAPRQDRRARARASPEATCWRRRSGRSYRRGS